MLWFEELTCAVAFTHAHDIPVVITRLRHTHKNLGNQCVHCPRISRSWKSQQLLQRKRVPHEPVAAITLVQHQQPRAPKGVFCPHSSLVRLWNRVWLVVASTAAQGTHPRVDNRKLAPFPIHRLCNVHHALDHSRCPSQPNVDDVKAVLHIRG